MSSATAALLFALFVAAVVVFFAARWVADLGNALLYRLPRVRFGIPGRYREPPRLAVAREPFRPIPSGEHARGSVFYDGAVWEARCPVELAQEIAPGDRLEVTGIDHLELILGRRIREGEP